MAEINQVKTIQEKLPVYLVQHDQVCLGIDEGPYNVRIPTVGCTVKRSVSILQYVQVSNVRDHKENHLIMTEDLRGPQR